MAKQSGSKKYLNALWTVFIVLATAFHGSAFGLPVSAMDEVVDAVKYVMKAENVTKSNAVKVLSKANFKQKAQIMNVMRLDEKNKMRLIMEPYIESGEITTTGQLMLLNALGENPAATSALIGVLATGSMPEVQEQLKNKANVDFAKYEQYTNNLLKSDDSNDLSEEIQSLKK